MTPLAAVKLLVSVRNRAEWCAALKLGVDIVDLKEPRHGPLSPVDPVLWREAASDFADHRPTGDAFSESSSDTIGVPMLSAALGESAQAKTVASEVPGHFAFAKVGPSGCDSADRLRGLWDDVRGSLDANVELVAVAYADSGQAQTLSPERVFELAAAEGFDRCLVDTFVKDGTSTVDHLGIDRLQQLAALASENKIWWTLAGSVKTEHVSRLGQSNIYPNCFGVRGDVCDHGRTGTLDPQRVAAWNEVLDQACSLGPFQPG